MGQKYIHGYNADEQERLNHQSDFLQSFIHEGIDLSGVNHLFEMGCGTGGQTKILLNNFPQLKITAIDISSLQIEAAKENINKYPELSGRVNFSVADAANSNFPNENFDGAFICWVLEHAPEPQKIISEAKRCLKSESPLIITEVFNASLYLQPHPEAVINYWNKFNQIQIKLGGDPFIGMKLGNMLVDSGFTNIKSRIIYQHHDKKDSAKRKLMLDYFHQLMLSAKKNLLQHKMITQLQIDEMNNEMETLKSNPETIFFLMGVQATAYA